MFGRLGACFIPLNIKNRFSTICGMGLPLNESSSYSFCQHFETDQAVSPLLSIIGLEGRLGGRWQTGVRILLLSLELSISIIADTNIFLWMEKISRDEKAAGQVRLYTNLS